MAERANELIFLVNGKSRSGAKSGDETREALQAAGFTIKDYHLTSKVDQFDSLLRSALQRKEPLIAVGGGDGTLRHAAELVAGTDSVLAVVPLGTGNAWAKDLGIPVGPTETAQALIGAGVEVIDLGVMNGRGFVNVATVGLTSLIVKNLPKGSKGMFGRLVYLPAVVRSLKELRPFELHVETEGDSYSGMALQFVAAAGRTHAGPFKVTRRSSNHDGKLSLYALDSTDNKGLLKFGLALVAGVHTLLNEVWSCEAYTAKVLTHPSKRVIVDGEPSGQTPLELSVRPGALRVLVPSKAEPGAESEPQMK